MGKEKGMEDITTEANWSIPASGKAESLMDMALNIRFMVANLNMRKEDGGTKERKMEFSSNTVMGSFADGDFGAAITCMTSPHSRNGPSQEHLSMREMSRIFPGTMQNS
jgi:hypothetical protein